MTHHPIVRNWRECWQCDTDRLVATHESGLTVQFTETKDRPGVFDGAVKGDIPESLDWRSNPNLLAKLMRQAGNVMSAALERDAKR